MKREEIISSIRDWEYDNQESFNDYFSHDYIDFREWGEFLKGQGVERSVEILKTLDSGENYLDQDVLFEIKPVWSSDLSEEENRENFDYNSGLLADFFLSNVKHYGRFMRFINSKEY